MPKIISSAELRNKYNEVSEQCHRYGEPTFVTKNGKGDLAIMSMDTYERLTAGGMAELYGLLDEGHADVESGRTRPASEVIESLRERLNA